MSGNRVAEINPEDHPTVCGMQKIAADLLPVHDLANPVNRSRFAGGRMSIDIKMEARV